MKFNFNGFTENGNNAINYAIETAENFGHTYVGSEHLLIGLLKTEGVAKTILEQKKSKDIPYLYSFKSLWEHSTAIKNY